MIYRVLILLFILNFSYSQDEKNLKYFGKDYFVIDGTKIHDSKRESI